jgi:glutamine amidotransferase
MIYILDYGMGNLKSVLNAFLFNNIKAQITNRADDLKYADMLVVPGVGAFRKAIEELEKSDLIEAIKDFIATGKSYLGICLGMQILFEKSLEFGSTKGLALLKGDIINFPNHVKQKGFKIPHMGWNTVKLVKKHAIFNDIGDNSYFYFDHSFAYFDKNEYSLGICEHGCSFNAAVIKDNVIGVQFHPEKSGLMGLKMIKNFSTLC